MDRRRFIETGACAAGITLLGSMAKSSLPSRPNIIFILTDDHRYDAFGFLDKPWLKTPNMDRMAKEGVHFENSFVTTSLCSPSRASFLTGQYASRHGVQNNATPWRESNVTFLEALNANGYRTAFIGKWHMPGQGIPDLTGQGKVDRMVSFSLATGQGIYKDCPLIIDGQKTKKDGYITDVLTDYALEFMDAKSRDPFCLYLSHKAVHYNFTPPERHKGKLDGMPLNEMEENTRKFPMGSVHVPQRIHFKRNQQGYYESLMAVDDSIGKVLDLLDSKGLAENTLIVYAGDNGYFWGEHGLIDKRYAYEESIRIPHLMRWPALVRDGDRKVKEMVLNIDLAPALMQAAGLKPLDRMQGKSWLEPARGKNIQWRKEWLYEYFEDPFFPHPEIKAARTEDWKLITYKDKKDRFPDEMYNISEDPGERNDLSKNPEYADKKKELEKKLEKLIKEAAA